MPGQRIDRRAFLAAGTALMAAGTRSSALAGPASSGGGRRLNNLVSEIFRVSSIRKADSSFSFARNADGWIFISASYRGSGTLTVLVDNEPIQSAVGPHADPHTRVAEAFRFVAKGAHRIGVRCERGMRVDELVVRAIPELIDCGLFDPAIRAFAPYDMNFLKKDVLPNITTLEAPANIQLPQAVMEDWHRQGKKLIVHVGVSPDAKTAGGHLDYWARTLQQCPFADGIIIDEFIVNEPMKDWKVPLTPERLKRIDEERQRNRVCEVAFQQMPRDPPLQGQDGLCLCRGQR